MLKEYKSFSLDFLTKHHSIILFDAFHQIKASLLYPPNCSCAKPCQCEDFRTKIILTLNLEFFNKIQEQRVDAEFIAAMRHLLCIPEDSFLKSHYTQSFPVWLIDENFKQKEAEHHFKIVSRLVWTLLRLAKTYDKVGVFKSRASVNEALEIILGTTPLKAKTNEFKKDEYLCGEKGYAKHLNTYKSLCHIIAASEYLREECGKDIFDTTNPEDIDQFLRVSYWIRQELLILQTPNVKGNTQFSEEILIPLPVWVTNEAIQIPVEPFEEKLRLLEEEIRNAPSYRSTSEYKRKNE